MADSDEEYDRRKGRDKFRRERNDYERRDDRRRDPRQWDHDRSNGRSSWGGSRDRRDPYREYDSHRRDRAYSPGRRDMSPPQAKRMRRDTWEDGGGGGGGGYPYGFNGPPSGGGGSGHPPGWSGNDPDGAHGPGQGREDQQTQPPMMTFKAFLQSLPDNISDQDAIKKFNEYKMDFKKQQINEFFLQHKEEEWFKTKYHPEECAKRQEEVRTALKRRCEVFMEFMESGRVASVGCDIERNEELVKLLDAVVIKLEGGTDFDLTVLDQPESEEPGTRSRNNSESVTLDLSPDEKKKRKKEESEKKPDEPLKLPITAEQKELMKKAQEFSKQQQAKNGSQEGKKSKKKKRNRDKTEYSYESGSDSESESGSDSDSEPAPPGMEDEPPPPGTEASEDNIPGVSSTDDVTESKPKEEDQVMEEKDVDTSQDDSSPKPKALHKTCSIFLRNLAPSITKQEVEAMCKRYPGFVRVALQDPQPERRFFRRGWVTFERDVNIKEICWNLNNIRLRDCELGATLNRELKQRIRPVNGITAHKQIVKADIKLAAKIIQNLDVKWRMWEDDSDEKKDEQKEAAFESVMKNPILKNVTDFLIDEGDFEEEELLGQSIKDGDGDTKSDEIKMDRDENMIKALDSMILYLRIVHSIDFYSCNEYPNEDEMPHRCGIMHARCVPPTTKVTQNDINEWIKNFENKIKTLTEHHDPLPDEEVVKLGKKDPEAEVEKFVTANTQELAKDKWLCPISGKKFKGPEFVRKHIFNKHGEKVEEVKMEVAFFNNYLMDSKRPALPEHPGNKQGSSSRTSTGAGDQFTSPSGYQSMPHMGYSDRGGGPHVMYSRGGGGGPQSYHSPSYHGREPYRGGYGRSGYNRYRSNRPGRNQSDPRRVIEYRDLDAPDDSDIF